MSLFAVSQILVGIAICTDMLSFQFKKRVHIVSCLLVSCTLISIHFMCLGHWTAACMGLLAAARFITCVFTTDRKVRTLFVLATLIVSMVTYEGLLSVLCTVGGLFGIYASFCEDDKPLRQLMAVGTSIWLLHNILAGSPGAVLMEILFLGSNFVGYFRYYIRPQKQALG
ncbi:YgjV family protein [Desulfopila sp. IMCC35008]|uniref:YgjV family protein n=1 Tax=Desulfopila sp. IMCC35008 TaxID=2653858 RepID=UPI0013D11005